MTYILTLTGHDGLIIDQVGLDYRCLVEVNPKEGRIYIMAGIGEEVDVSYEEHQM